jgi:hypothetical protein
MKQYKQNRERLGRLFTQEAPQIAFYAQLCPQEGENLYDSLMEFLELAFEEGRAYQLERMSFANYTSIPAQNPYEAP